GQPFAFRYGQRVQHRVLEGPGAARVDRGYSGRDSISHSARDSRGHDRPDGRVWVSAGDCDERWIDPVRVSRIEPGGSDAGECRKSGVAGPLVLLREQGPEDTRGRVLRGRALTLSR